MAKCVNISHPDYKSLARQYRGGQKELKARIATWQELNNTDIFPSLQEIEGDISIRPVETVEEIQRNNAAKELNLLGTLFPSLNSDNLSILKSKLDTIINNNGLEDLRKIDTSLRYLDKGLINNREANQDAMYYIWKNLLSLEEKNRLLKLFPNNKSIEALTDLYLDYVYEDTTGIGELDRIFKSLDLVGDALKNNYSFISKYYSSKEHHIYDPIELRMYQDAMTRRKFGRLGTKVFSTDQMAEYNAEEARLNNILNDKSLIHTFKRGDSMVLRVDRPKKSNYKQQALFSKSDTQNVSKEQLDIIEKDKKRFLKGKTQLTLGELMSNMGESLKDSGSLKSLATFLMDKLKDSNISVEVVADMFLTPGNYKLQEGVSTAHASYEVENNRIILSQSGINAVTILHEAVHAASIDFLRNKQDTQTYKDFEKLYNAAKERFTGTDRYYVNSIEEFIAGIFTNADFVRELVSMDPIEDVKPYRNLIQQLFDYLLEALGFKQGTTLYEQAYAVGTNILAGLELSTEVNEALTAQGNTLSNINKTRAARMANLRNKFTLTDIKDISHSLTDAFMDIVSENEQFEDKYKGWSRFNIIKDVTPPAIFKTMQEDFRGMLDSYTRAVSNTKDPIRKQQYQFYASNLSKLLDNFEDMLLYAAEEIGFMEGINFNFKDYTITPKDLKSENDDGNSSEEDFNDGFISEHEYAILDGWQKNFVNTSVSSSLTTKVKKALRNIDELNNGAPVRNIIGTNKKLNMEVVKNTLLGTTRNIIEAKDMVPLLEKLQGEKAWVQGIIEQLREDDELFSQFYGVFAKDFVKYGITNTSKNPDGTISYKTMFINQSDSLNLYLEEWRGNLERGDILEKLRGKNPTKSIYDSTGKFIQKNIDKNLDTIQSLNKEIATLRRDGTAEERQAFLNSNAKTIRDLLRSTGIATTTDEVKELIQDFVILEANGVTMHQNRINTLLDTTAKTLTWATKNPDSKALDLMQNNRGNYSTIAKLMTNQLQSLIEAAVFQRGKSYYTYLQPSYLTKLTKQLKGLQLKKADYDKFIQDQFKQFEGTIYDPVTKKYNISWLNKLTEKSPKFRELFDHKVELNFNNTDYDALNSTDYANMLLVNYFAQKDYAWYHVPILADAPLAQFIKFDKVTTPNYKEEIAEELLGVFQYEYSRIKVVRERKGLETENIANLDKHGDKFHFLKFFNEHLETIDKFANSPETNPVEFKNWIKGVIIENLDIKADESINNLRKLGLLDKADNNFIALKNLGINDTNYRDMLHNYFYNSYLATTNIIQITNTDLAYYKNIEDFQKRNKQISAPGVKPNTQATYNGQRLGKDMETTIYLADDIQKSNTNTLRNLNINFVVNNNKLSNLEKANIITKYGDSNAVRKGNYIHVTKRSRLLNLEPGYYRKSGRSYEGSTREEFDSATHNLQEIYLVNHNNNYTFVPTQGNNITDAQAYRTLDSYRSIVAMTNGWNDNLEESYQRFNKGEWDIKDWNTIWQAFKPFMYTQVAVDSGTNQLLKVPVQHKNSEALLLPIHAMQHYTDNEGRDYIPQRLRGLMEAMSKNNIDVVMFESAVKVGLQGVVDINGLNTRQAVEQTISKQKNNPNVFHKVPYEDYKIQQPIPDHLQDTQQLFGTQLRKLIQSDISENAVFTVNDKKFTKGELVKLYNDTIIENVLQSYDRVKKMFSNPVELQAAIEAELQANERYSKDLINACQLVDGQFILPLYDPSQSVRVQQLLNSIWKSRVTKQKIKGGSVVQVSAFGLSDTLQIKFKDDGAVDYVEAYLPWWSNDMPEEWSEFGFIDESTGIMDAQKMVDLGIIDERILEAISYRIPTEDKYSMLPIKIKGFLPRNAGGNIMLPAEITTITGSDYDIDKQYLTFKEFKLVNDEFGNRNKFKMVEYDLSEDVKDQTLEQRNNLLVDIMRSILTNPDTTEKMLNPGNFDGPKKTARILNILSSGQNYTYNQLNAMNLDELDAINSRNELDMLDYTTQLYLHKQNMTAAKLIGMVATHSVNHAVRQFTNIEVSNKEIPHTDESGNKTTREVPRFTINGKFNTSLHDMLVTNSDGTQTYISKNYASFENAAVDAVKDPVLAYLNLNTFTADSAMLLTGLGYSFNEIGLFLRQPVIEEVVDYFDKNNKRGISKRNAVDALIYKYKKILTDTLGDKYKPNYNNQFTEESMAENIKLSNLINKAKTLEGNELNKFLLDNRGVFIGYYSYQLDVLNNYSEILEVSQKLADLVTSMRADTQGGAAGPTIAHTIFKSKKVETNKRNANPKSGKPVLLNSDIINLTLSDNTDDNRQILRNSPIGFIQAFTSLGIEGNLRAMERWFPQNKEYFRYIIDNIEESLKTGKMSVDTMNNVITEFYAYYMSQFDFFKQSNENGDFVKTFPNRFKKMVDSNEDLKKLTFIKNIKFVKADKNIPIPKLKFVSGGKLSSNIRDEIILEWETLLQSSPEDRQLAIDLFKYNYFVNGFGFGATSFMHLAPTAVKLEVPEYVERLRSLMGMGFHNSELDDTATELSVFNLKVFIDQYFRNHLGNRQLVPEISADNNTFIHDDKVASAVEISIPKGEPNEFLNHNGVPLRFVYKKVGDKDLYYAINDVFSEEDGSTTVRLISVEPLGLRNNFLEYNYGNPNYSTVITEDDYSTVNDRSEYQQYSFDAASAQDAYDYDYTPNTTELPIPKDSYLEDMAAAFAAIDAELFGNVKEDLNNIVSFDTPQTTPEQGLVNDVGKDTIEDAKNKCK